MIKTVAELAVRGETPEVLFWVGYTGSFDDRAKRIIEASAHLLQKAGVRFVVLGTEESYTGDPAKRADSKFFFQMQAMMNIKVLNSYQAIKIVTTYPHCFNTIKNGYPALDGNYEIMHHTQLPRTLIDEGRLTVEASTLRGKRITFHDPCYLGGANKVYNTPCELLSKLEIDLVEMKKCKSRAMCYGTGRAQMSKKAEKGGKEIDVLRTEQALEVRPDIITTTCPFCSTVMTDGVETKEKETQVKIYDVTELIADENPIL